jgi:multicomponent Na+:H+ antiporter subunit E
MGLLLLPVYLVRFLWAVVMANLQVAGLLFLPNHKLKPALVRVPLRVRTDGQILCLTSMITLTPGTLSLEVAPDRSSLIVHVIHVEDPDESVRSIRDGFESWVMRVWGQKS